MDTNKGSNPSNEDKGIDPRRSLNPSPSSSTSGSSLKAEKQISSTKSTNLSRNSSTSSTNAMNTAYPSSTSSTNVSPGQSPKLYGRDSSMHSSHPHLYTYGTIMDKQVRLEHLYSPHGEDDTRSTPSMYASMLPSMGLGAKDHNLSTSTSSASSASQNEPTSTIGMIMQAMDIDDDDELFPLLLKNSRANMNSNLDPRLFDILYATMIEEEEVEKNMYGKGYYCCGPLFQGDRFALIGFLFFRKVLLPNNIYLQRWDMLLTFALLWTAVITPYTVCVVMTSDKFINYPITLFTIDLILDLIFILDVWVSFRRAYWNGRRLVTERDKIRNNYVFSFRFLVDLVAAIPVDMIVRLDYSLTYGTRFVGYLRFFLLFRLFRLLRIQSVLSSSYFYRRLEMQVSSALLAIIRVFMLVLLVNHWGACIWVWIGRYEHQLEPFDGATWITLYQMNTPDDIGEEMNTKEDFHLYILALYWAIQTTSSIGYGDISPHQPTEYMYAVCFMFMGSAINAYAIALIVGLVNELERERRFRSHLIDEVNYVIDGAHGRIPEEQANRMRYFVYEVTKSTAFNQRRRKADGEIFDVLSKELRDEFVLAETKDWIALIPFMRKFAIHYKNLSLLANPDEKQLSYGRILQHLANKLKWRAFGEGETIDLNEEEGLMIIIHGTIAAGVLKKKPASQNGSQRAGSARGLSWADKINSSPHYSAISIPKDVPSSPFPKKKPSALEFKRSLQNQLQPKESPAKSGKSKETKPAEKTLGVDVEIAEKESAPEVRLHTRGAVWGADCISYAASKSLRKQQLRRGICVTFVECYYLRRADIYEAFRLGGADAMKHLRYIRLRMAFRVWARKVLRAPAQDIFDRGIAQQQQP